MKRILALTALLMPLVALADSDTAPVVVNGNHVSVVAPNATPSSLNLMVPNAGGVFTIQTGNTERFRIDGAGKTSGGTPVIITPAATPVEGTNDIKARVSVFPTAAASTAACLPSVPTVGEIHLVVNKGPNAVRVKACGTPGINGAAAGTYIPLATFQAAECVADTTTSWQCNLKTVPTPAGP